jgi:hypothetical protein
MASTDWNVGILEYRKIGKKIKPFLRCSFVNPSFQYSVIPNQNGLLTKAQRGKVLLGV